MTYVEPPQPVRIVTTSWDDGHPLDLRIAELLGKFQMKGSFYVPLKRRRRPLMDPGHLRSLADAGMEVGSHTMTHAPLTRARDPAAEMRNSKARLEDLLGAPVLSLCYPDGRFNSKISLLCAESGYRLGRTTMSFRPELPFDPYAMPTCFQLFPHNRTAHMLHAVRERNWKGISNWSRLWNMSGDIITLAELGMQHVLKFGGIMHVWGHSWEIEEFGLWDLLIEVLSRIARHPKITYFTNLETVVALSHTNTHSVQVPVVDNQGRTAAFAEASKSG